jgi:PKHD-type hydroxylase
MLIVIPDVLPPADALALGSSIASEAWVDGNATSGSGAALVKRNRQLPEASAAAREAQRIVQKALAGNALFLSAALPARIYPPLFNRYGVGDAFGAHVDNAIRVDPSSGTQMRTDLSATLFLSDPDRYEGGDLIIESEFGRVSYKLPAGHMLLYPATSLHSVSTITKGERISSFFWLQSIVRDGAAREMLFDLDQSVQSLTLDRGGDDAEVLRLTRLYHNLVRRWGA